MRLAQVLTHPNINARKLAIRLIQEDLNPIRITGRIAFYYIFDTGQYSVVPLLDFEDVYAIHYYPGIFSDFNYPTFCQFIKYTSLEGVIAFLKEKLGDF